MERGDGLPERICNECWNVVSSSRELQTVSLKSNRHLNKILKSHSSDAVQQRSEFIKIEFIDTESNVDREPMLEINCSENELTQVKTELTIETNCSDSDLTQSKTDESSAGNANKKTDRKKKYSEKKISCEMCGKLIEYKIIDYHLNMHKGLCVLLLITDYNCSNVFFLIL